MNFSSTDTLLLIIDIQKDFCDKKGNHAKRGKGLTNIQAILPKLQVFYTRAKSAGIPVIFTKFISGKTLSPENMKYFLKKHVEYFNLFAFPKRQVRSYIFFHPIRMIQSLKKYLTTPLLVHRFKAYYKKSILKIFLLPVYKLTFASTQQRNALSQKGIMYLLLRT